MIPLIGNYFNSTVIDATTYYVFKLFALVNEVVGISSTNTFNESERPLLLQIFDLLISWFAFDDFQITLLKVFLSFLCVNLVCIYISWKIYGRRISEKFMKPATPKAIEELKKSVFLLKLPKEHSPRV